MTKQEHADYRTRAMRQPADPRLEKLAGSDPVFRACIEAYRMGNWTWEQAITEALLEIAKQRDSYREYVTKHSWANPPAIDLEKK